MSWLGVKWPEKGWYAVKQNNQPTKVNIVEGVGNRKHCLQSGLLQRNQ